MRVLWITGMPRSGTSWLGKIFASHPEVLYHFEPFNEKKERRHNPKDLKFYNLVDKIEDVPKNRQETRIAMMHQALSRFWNCRDRSLDRRPFFAQPEQPRIMVLKSPRIMPIADVCEHFGQIIYIVRDPRAVISSLWRTEFGKSYPARGTAKRWAQRSDHFLEAWGERPELYLIIKYEDLVNYLESMAKALCAWADLPWSVEQERFIRRSHSAHRDHPYSVFKDPKKVLGVWKNHLSGAAQKIIKDAVAESKTWEKLYRGGES